MMFKQVENVIKILSDKAFELYSDTSPIAILTDGESYKVTGAFEMDCGSEEELNAALEELADTLGEVE